MIQMICETCGAEGAIKAKVPWGRTECERCRSKTGKCLICGVNRNDCSC